MPAPNGRMDGWKMREKGIAQLTPLARHLTPPISGWNERELREETKEGGAMDGCWKIAREGPSIRDVDNFS